MPTKTVVRSQRATATQERFFAKNDVPAGKNEAKIATNINRVLARLRIGPPFDGPPSPQALKDRFPVNLDGLQRGMTVDGAQRTAYYSPKDRSFYVCTVTAGDVKNSRWFGPIGLPKTA